MTTYACNDRADAISVAKTRSKDAVPLLVFRRFGIFVVTDDAGFDAVAELVGEAVDGVWLGPEDDAA